MADECLIARIDSALPDRDFWLWVVLLLAIKSLGPVTTLFAAQAGYGELNPLVEWVTVVLSHQPVTALSHNAFVSALWVVSIGGLVVLILVVELMTRYAERQNWRPRVTRAGLYSSALMVFLFDAGRNLWIII